MKDRYKISLKIKSKKELPNFGLGSGILATQEILMPHDADLTLVDMKLDEISKILIDEIIEINIEKYGTEEI